MPNPEILPDPDIDQQQKYLQILQHATAELLEVIPLKNSIPDEFNF